MSIDPSVPPPGYEKYLGPYGPQAYDSYCGAPVGWGFKLIAYLGDEKFKELRNKGHLECLRPTWVLLTKILTREEAIKQYGHVTEEIFGPLGGWKSVTFGTTRFLSKKLASEQKVTRPDYFLEHLSRK